MRKRGRIVGSLRQFDSLTRGCTGKRIERGTASVPVHPRQCCEHGGAEC